MKEKQEHDIRHCEESMERMKSFLDKDGFCEPQDARELMDSMLGLRDAICRGSSGILFRFGLMNRHLKDIGPEFVAMYDSMPSRVHNHNISVASTLIQDLDRKINPVEGHPLDEQQLIAISMDVRNRLIIAGAGAGKTSTIVGLAKHLFSSGRMSAEDVLFISFTNNSVNDLLDRIAKETKQRADVTTFHRLGMRILAESDGVVPKVFDGDVHSFVKNDLTRRMSDLRFLSHVVSYLVMDCRYVGDEDTTSNGFDREKYLTENPLVTLNGEMVKSYGEAEIADYLLMQGIRYTYEEPYMVDTRTSEHGQYRPDFHITGTNVYIEYFGTDRDGNVAPFFRSRDGKDPSEEYRAGMEWKRRIHEENRTVLIELYAYQRSEGTLLETLDGKLDEAGIRRGEVDTSALYSKVTGGDDRIFGRLVDQLSTALMLIKGTGKPFDEAFPSETGIRESLSLRRCRRILEPVYGSYQKMLKDSGMIDFEDMLNLAADRVTNGQWTRRYRYLVVDEYQDLSRSRYRLLKALRDSCDSRLFCVGDDWQSIYRFNGSDVGYILDFERYWGPSETCFIDTCHRFSGDLLRQSNAFMNGREGQIQKSLRPGTAIDSRLEIIYGYDNRSCGEAVWNRIKSIPVDESILILGRFRHNIMTLEASGFSWKPDVGGKTFTVTCPSGGRRVGFMTIHGSKGLQADHVFVLNNVHGPGGFPDIRPEPLIVDRLLSDTGSKTDEERRLFYVAITRARKGAYIVTVKGRESVFVRELPAFQDSSGRLCPECGGTLVIREGPYGKFLGCSNYRNGCRYKRKINS